ncbi:MAG TPA: phosphopantothenoylcysteine decarboxylase [Pirellulales bacterium]
MARLLLTSGPTREYFDPVRYLTNASGGRMGKSLAEAALASGHSVVIVSGPVGVAYPPEAEVIHVVTTTEMRDACLEVFPSCDGVIGVAAPCDYRPAAVSDRKLQKTGQPLLLELEETPDILSALARVKEGRPMVAFALETDDAVRRAQQKLRKKGCDLIVLNGLDAMQSAHTAVRVINSDGEIIAQSSGEKEVVATDLMELFDATFNGWERLD